VGHHHAATGLAHLASEHDAVPAHVISRLDLAAIVLAGILIIWAVWDWLRG